MSRKPCFITPLLLVAALALVGCGDGGGNGSAGTGPFALEKAPADTLATMCPDGALAFIRINNLKAIEGEIKGLAGAVNPAAAEEASILKNLGMMMGNPDLDGVAVDKPTGIALFMGGMGPMPAVIVPLSDKAAFEAKVGQNPSVKVVGDYAAWAPDPSILEGVKAGGEASKLASSLMAADVAIAVDMTVAQPLMAPMFGQMDQIVSMIQQQMPGPVGGMYGDMASSFKRIMNDAGELGIAANLADGKLDIVYRYVAKDGSETAKKIAAGISEGKSLMGYIDDADFAAMEMRGSGEAMWDWFGSMYESMFAGADPEVLDMLKKSFTLLDGIALGISMDGGISETFVMGVKDEKEYEKILDTMPKLFGSMMDSMKNMMPGGEELPMDMSFSQGETWEHAGVKVRSYSFKMAMKDMPGMPPEASDAMKKMMTKLFGSESMDYHVAIVNGHAVGVVGAKARERTAALIEKVKSGKAGDAPAAFAAATKGFPGNTDMVLHLDFGSLLKMISDMPEIPPPLQQQFANPPAGLGMSAYLANDGKAVSFGMRYDLKAVMTFIGQFVPK